MNNTELELLKEMNNQCLALHGKICDYLKVVDEKPDNVMTYMSLIHHLLQTFNENTEKMQKGG